MACPTLTAHVAVEGASFSALAMGLIGERVNSACVDPAVVEVEQGADGDGEVDPFVGPAGGVEELHIFRRDAGRVAVDLVDEAEQRFVFVVKR